MTGSYLVAIWYLEYLYATDREKALENGALLLMICFMTVEVHRNRYLWTQ